MNVFDFDNTIYDGESPADFFLFCLRKDKRLLKYAPILAKAEIRYKMGRLSGEQLLQETAALSSYFKDNRDQLQEIVAAFWKKNHHKLKPFMMEKIKEDDLIATASPDFLIEPVRAYLPKCRLMCSEFDLDKGRFSKINYQERKVRNIKAAYPKEIIETVYTDSQSDAPLIKTAREAYLVKKDWIKKVK